MEAVDILGLLVPITYFGMLLLEKIWPARTFPAVKRWRLVGVVFFVVMATVSTVVPLLLPAAWLATHRLVDGTRLGVVGGAAVGYLVLSGVSYAWHRAAHTVTPMWRGFHQMHHAPQRMDMGGAAVFHPTEMIAFSAIGTVVLVVVLGLDPLAAAVTNYIAAFYSFFQHLNVRTPQWLGYFIQRPEAHCVHHQRNVHAYNYGDLPIWDIVFGTFRNPATFEGSVGFDGPALPRFAAILAFHDVNDTEHVRGAAMDAAAHTAR